MNNPGDKPATLLCIVMRHQGTTLNHDSSIQQFSTRPTDYAHLIHRVAIGNSLRPTRPSVRYPQDGLPLSMTTNF